MVETVQRAGEETIKVFISYSRTDAAFANELVLGLAACGFAPYIDRRDIAAGEDWSQRLTGLIDEADTVAYVVSPDSVSSENCGHELAEAIRLSKRILPVVWCAVPDEAAPDALRRLNYIFFSGEGRSFASGLADLAAALRTDIGWIREHTRLAALAQRWSGRSRPETLLLRGEDIDAAQGWLNDKPLGAIAVTDDQADFIKASADARIEANRRAVRARRRTITVVSLIAASMAALAVVAVAQWRSAQHVVTQLTATNISLDARKKEVEGANLRLGADIWLRTAPSDDGYFIAQGWYPVAASYSGAIARVIRSGGGRPSVMSSGFIIDGAIVHAKYAGQPLLVIPAGDIVDSSAMPRPALRPAAKPTPGPPPAPRPPSDTLAADDPVSAKMAYAARLQAEEDARHPPSGVAAMPPQSTLPPPARAPADTLAPTDPHGPQTMLVDTSGKGVASHIQGVLPGDIAAGPRTISAAFPGLDRQGVEPAAPIQGAEIVWETPPQAAAELHIQIWRLAAAPPFGWRAIRREEIGCAAPGAALGEARAVAALAVGVPVEGGQTPRALTLNVSELTDRSDPRKLLYTHATSIVSGGAPVFELATGRVFAIHYGSEPDPKHPGRRQGFGYSLGFLLDVVRQKMGDAAFHPEPICPG